MSARTVTDRTLSNARIQIVLDQQTQLLTQLGQERSRQMRAVRSALEWYARRIVGLALTRSPVRPSASAIAAGTWRDNWADTAEYVMDEAGAQQFIGETARVLQHRFPRRIRVSGNLILISLLEIGSYVGQVARMINVGLDPELLVQRRQQNLSPQRARQSLGESVVIVAPYSPN